MFDQEIISKCFSLGSKETDSSLFEVSVKNKEYTC